MVQQKDTASPSLAQPLLGAEPLSTATKPPPQDVPVAVSGHLRKHLQAASARLPRKPQLLSDETHKLIRLQSRQLSDKLPSKPPSHKITEAVIAGLLAGIIVGVLATVVVGITRGIILAMLAAGLVGSLEAWPAPESPQPESAPDPQVGLGKRNDVRVFSGFTERVYRLGFEYEDRFAQVIPALLTVSPSGAAEKGGFLPPLKKQGLLSPAYPQSVALEVAQQPVNVADGMFAGKSLAETPFVWKRDDGSFGLSQTWPARIDQAFQHEFEVFPGVNPDPVKFQPQAEAEFRETLVRLFGSQARHHQILFCRKCTVNDSPVLIGTSEKLIQHLQEQPQMLPRLGIARLRDSASFVAEGTDAKGERFEKEVFMDPGEEYAVYRLSGPSGLGCAVPHVQFVQEAELQHRVNGIPDGTKARVPPIAGLGNQEQRVRTQLAVQQAQPRDFASTVLLFRKLISHIGAVPQSNECEKVERDQQLARRNAQLEQQTLDLERGQRELERKNQELMQRSSDLQERCNLSDTVTHELRELQKLAEMLKEG